MEVNLNYGFNEDAIQRLQKDLNHLLTNLDSGNVRNLNTNFCDIYSDKGETIIDGPLIDMFDYDPLTSHASTTLRLRMGYNASSSNFCFKLFNNAGVETISLDSCGNAIFKGDIDTAEDVNVGNNIYLGVSGSLGLKGVYFNSTIPITATSTGYHIGYETSDGRSGIFWDAFANLVVMCSTHDVEISGQERVYLGVAPVQASTLVTQVTFKSRVELSTDMASMGIDGVNYFQASSDRANVSPGYNQDAYVYGLGSSAECVLGWSSTDTGTIDNYVLCSTNGVTAWTTQNVYLGMSTGNAYLGTTNLSTNRIATQGWCGAKVIYVQKTTESVVTNSIVLYDDPHFTIGLEANTWYMVEAFIAPYATAAGPMLRLAWSTEGYYQQGARACIGPSTNGSALYNTHCIMAMYSSTDNVTYGIGNSAAAWSWVACVREQFTFLTMNSTARLTMKWAQKTASTTPLRLSTYSRMVVHKLT